MSYYNPDDDPVLKQLLREHDHAYREHRRALIDLRRLHLNNDNPEAIRTALLQQIACEAAQKLEETTRALSAYGWELVPYSTDPKLLAKIAQARAESIGRIETPKTKDEPRGKSSIIVNLNGRVREYFE